MNNTDVLIMDNLCRKHEACFISFLNVWSWIYWKARVGCWLFLVSFHTSEKIHSIHRCIAYFTQRSKLSINFFGLPGLPSADFLSHAFLKMFPSYLDMWLFHYTFFLVFIHSSILNLPGYDFFNLYIWLANYLSQHALL